MKNPGKFNQYLMLDGNQTKNADVKKAPSEKVVPERKYN
jgi:hypothetical protein